MIITFSELPCTN